MKKIWNHVTKWQKLFIVTIVLVGILWMTGFDPVDSGVILKEVEAATIVHSGKSGNLNWSIDDEGCLLIEGDGDYSFYREWTKYSDSIKSAVVEVKNITSLRMLFYKCTKLEKVDLTGLDTSKVTNMENMFYKCDSLKNIDLSTLDISKTTNMGYMFYKCTNLTSVDLSNLNTSNVVNMGHMFHLCENLVNINLNGIDTSHVVNMEYMFGGCENLTNVDISNFDTSAVTNMQAMFSWCKKLTRIDVSGFDTSEVTDMNKMFQMCEELEELNLSTLDTSKVTNMENMFYNCKKIKIVNVSKFNTSKVINMSMMFDGCESAERIDVSGFDTSNVISMDYMFFGCKKITGLDVNKFDTSKVTDMRLMFDRCENAENIDVSGFDTSKVADMESMFQGCKNIRNVDVSKFDTSNVSSMRMMFGGCENVGDIDVSQFDTSKVTNMYSMFEGCTNLISVDVSGFDTSKVTDMRRMFYGCENVENINVSGFDTSNVDDMGYIFTGCESLKSLDISRLDTSKVTNLESIFDGCTNLEDLNVGNLNTSNVINMDAVFYNCAKLTSLDLSSFDISKVTSLNSTFMGCTSLERINTPINKDKEKGYLPKVENMQWEDISGMTYSYLPGNMDHSIVLNRKIPRVGLKSEFITLEKTAYEYTGTPIQPAVTVKDTAEKVLTEDTDYTVSYENNTNVGTATVTITGKGNYTGTILVEFMINPKVLTLKDGDITIDNNGFACDGNRYRYTGEEIKPILAINGLTEGTDYELSYKNNVREGTATATVICKGNYTGEYIYEYTIVKEPVFTWNKDKCTSDTGIPKVTVRERINLTCGKAGKILYVATLEHMGKVYTSENEVQLLETGKHSWDEGVVKGSQLIYTCKVCKQTKSVEKKVKSIAITGLSHNIAAGKKVALTAGVCPVDAINKKVVWTTSNKKVATVNQSGIVSVLKKTGKKSVIITATATDGSRVKQSFKITSMKGVVKKVSLSGKKTLAVGKSMKVKAKVKASGGSYKKLKWTSSNAKYATVSSKGTVKAQKAGKGKKVTITAMALDGSGKKATLKIKVK